MISDHDIQQGVQAEFGYTLGLDATELRAEVRDGAVILTGYARNDLEKARAEAAVKHLAGVTAVVNGIRVKAVECMTDPYDPHLVQELLEALREELPLGCATIKPFIHRGRVTLEGRVEQAYQRARAEKAVRRVRGVLSVCNRLRIEPQGAPSDIDATG